MIELVFGMVLSLIFLHACDTTVWCEERERLEKDYNKKIDELREKMFAKHDNDCKECKECSCWDDIDVPVEPKTEEENDSN